MSMPETIDVERNACFSPTCSFCAQQKVNSIGYEAKEGHTSVQARQAGPKIRKGLGDDMRFAREASTLLTDLPESSSDLLLYAPK